LASNQIVQLIFESSQQWWGDNICDRCHRNYERYGNKLFLYQTPFGLIEYNRMNRSGIEWSRIGWSAWNKHFILLFGYFKMERSKIDGKWWYEVKFILSYFISFNYYFSNPNNKTLLYSISLCFISLYFINPYKWWHDIISKGINQNILTL
jgi:hypothetical protein